MAGMKRFRAGWISDVHLGTRGSQAAALLDFLREYEFETLYVVGDLIDVWSLRRGIYWPQLHNDVIQKLLRAGRKGTRIIYIPGNHDEFVGTFSATSEYLHRAEGEASHRRRAHDPGDPRARARYGGAEYQVARPARRRGLPDAPEAQQPDQSAAPDASACRTGRSARM